MNDNYKLSREKGMDELENRYVLKRIVKSTDEYYTEALSIYTKETPVDIYTPSNEITIWLDKKTPCSSEPNHKKRTMTKRTSYGIIETIGGFLL